MNELPITMPVGPQSIRVFCGYRLPSLERDAFFKELGETFMPGTPCMLAPLGLNAYMAAVLDLDAAAKMPDEVALIVYASVQAYAAVRRDSLQGRMYTHSHAGVFDLANSRGQFPGPDSDPNRLAPIDRWSWFLFDQAVDWQVGSTRLVFLQGGPSTGSLQQALLDATRAKKESLKAAGIDQLIVVATSDYAALWFHGPGDVAVDPQALGFVPAGTKIARDMVATPVPMPTTTEGPTITGPAAYSFRFVRDLRYFL
jgi:hypothetical protein